LKAEIVCIGTELLLGHVVDTNASFVARELAELGIDLFHKATVGDNLQRIQALLEQVWQQADLIILSGGLGPTQDDLTREAVALLLREELEFNEDAWQQIAGYFQKTNRTPVASNRRQAMFPRSGEVIPNPFGTAPGLLVNKAGRILIALPGVPYELKGLWGTFVKPYLLQQLEQQQKMVITSRMVKMAGIGESAMEEKVIDLINNQSNPTIAPYAGQNEVYLRITAKSESKAKNDELIAQTMQAIESRLAEYIFGYDTDNLETVIGRILKQRGWRLAVAESCTGGLLAHRITNIPGCSEYYVGGINSYSNELKIGLLGVPEATIDTYGAVSEETAKAMAEGIKQVTKAHVGVAITGIAGPDGGTPNKPVGLVFIAVSLPDYTRVEKRTFPFDRLGNKEAAAKTALTLLWQELCKV